jgi:nuclear transport factor 2 (NTF2) superfamily protein
MDLGAPMRDLCAKKMKNEILVPPFSAETAAAKLSLNEKVWNTRDAEQVSLLYTEDVEWSDRITFLKGRAAVSAYLAVKFSAQRDYTVRKELWGAKENRNAVRFQEEWRDERGQWFHSYANEQLEFDEKGFIRKRFGCISDMAIDESRRSL